MGKVNRYELDGMVIDIPVKFDSYSKKHLEDFSEIIDHPKVTPLGRPVVLGIEEPCEWATDGVDSCDFCEHYQRAKEHAYFGICRHEKRRK